MMVMLCSAFKFTSQNAKKLNSFFRISKRMDNLKLELPNMNPNDLYLGEKLSLGLTLLSNLKELRLNFEE